MNNNLVNMLTTRENLNVESLRQAVMEQWQNGGHFTTTSTENLPNVAQFEHIPWEKVDCMLTKMVESFDDGLTFAFDMFPPQSAAKADLHVHPLSERVITVIDGHGHAFVKTADGSVATKAVEPGDVIVFPRNVPHSFWGSEEKPMVVQVVLGPHVPLTHPLHTVCPKKVTKLMAERPELLQQCDVSDLDALSKLVTQLVEQGQIELGEQQQMDWGEDIIKQSLLKANQVKDADKHDWACHI